MSISTIAPAPAPASAIAAAIRSPSVPSEPSGPSSRGEDRHVVAGELTEQVAEPLCDRIAMRHEDDSDILSIVD